MDENEEINRPAAHCPNRRAEHPASRPVEAAHLLEDIRAGRERI